MSYSEYADIAYQLPSADLIELTDDAGLGTIDATIINRAIADADNEIDLFIGVRYSLPLASTPGIIRRFSVDLAICWLFHRRASLAMPESWKDRCQETRENLIKIAQGELCIADLASGESSSYGISVTTDKDDRIFTMGRDSDSSSGTLDNY